MYRIGEFSILAKTTVKTLRHYEKMGLLIPAYIDKVTGYRFYETRQLLVLSKILSLRQIGLSIENIQKILKGEDASYILREHRKKIEDNLSILKNQLSRIDCLLEGKEMKYEAVIKEIPGYIVYYKEGTIRDYSDLNTFIPQSAQECLEANPNMKCVEPDYCFINYLDGEYRGSDIRVRYSQAVTEMGKETETIHFEKLEPIEAVCIYHNGSYQKLGEAYHFIMKWIEDNQYVVDGLYRERYIDGIWNKENEEDWVTEIQVPIRKRK